MENLPSYEELYEELFKRSYLALTTKQDLDMLGVLESILNDETTSKIRANTYRKYGENNSWVVAQCIEIRKLNAEKSKRS